mgnify:CR=1 FL=1|tara:strand:+ start:27824 stop:28471 length:648 start_codon:yes stop_codon:yes gene_type:complete
MRNKRFFFIVFEGIEGSGKTYQSKKLFTKIKKKGFKAILTREPGGTKVAEKIRKVILDDYFINKSDQAYDKYTDTLLYLAARNEHVIHKLIPAFNKKRIVICDRFVDSTFAYQVYGKKVNKDLINSVHKHILKKIKPNITFVLKINVDKALKRIKKRKKKNRYDKFSKDFYNKTQKAFIKIAKKNKDKYYIFDNTNEGPNIENQIFNIVMSKLIK